MTVSREALLVFNRGLVDRRALARIDVGRVALSAETHTNIIPRVLGSMTLRPGTEYHGNFASNNEGRYIPFVFAFDDVAVLEATASTLRIWDDGDTLVTRASVSASITNGAFTSDLTGWTDDDETGAASTWATGGYMQLLGTTYTEARRYQAVTITETTTVHGLRVVVQRGPLLLRIGSTAGDDDLFRQAVLRTGTHSIAFNPGGNSTVYVTFASALNYPVLVDSVSIEASGTVELPTPWATTANLQAMRYAQVGDIVFVACDGIQQRRIERRSDNSWSVVLYESNDGPFVGPDTSGIRLTPSALSGAITLTASRSLFASTSVGQIFSLTSQGQKVEADISAEASFSNSIRITGVDAARKITVVRAGTWSGTVSLQRSIGEEGSWTTVAEYTTNASVVYDDGLDNTIAFYRIGIETGNYTSGTAELSLTADVGSITGVVRVTGYTSATSVSAVVLEALGDTDGTEAWEEGSWSDLNGYPTAVSFAEGRLNWHGRGRTWHSVSDDLTSFDPNFEGDSGPINRAIGTGAVDVVNWALPLQRLILGTAAAEHSVRSTSFDEPITPTNFNIKEASTQGSAKVPAVRVGGRGYYVQRSGERIYELNYEIQKSDYDSLDLTALVPDIALNNSFVRLAVQMQPDTRIWGVREDGTVALVVRDPAEDVLGVIELDTDGEIEDVVILPGTTEDRVFWAVKRTVNGSTVRFHEEMQREDQCRGGTINRQADAALHYSGSSVTQVTGLDHLEGESVVAWGNGKDLGTYTVASGAITLSEAVTEAWIGLTYRGRYKSAKLAVERALGLHLTTRGRIVKVGFILADTHAQGLQYGPDFTTMDNLPLIENGAAVDTTSVWESYDEDQVRFPGDWDTDNRLCLEMNAPRPCTVMAVTVLYETEDAGFPRAGG